MKFVIGYTGLGVLLLGLMLLNVLSGGTLSSARSESVPMSVRENPGSYRSSYVTYSPTEPLPVARSSSSSSGGGYSFGK